MRSLGVDLAAADPTTAACLVAWEVRPSIEHLRPGGVNDDDLLSLARAANVTGIDAPFGWPTAFAEAVVAQPSGWASYTIGRD